MQKKLFTKLQTVDLRIHTESIVNSIINHLIEKSGQTWMANQFKRISTTVMTEQVMHKQINTVGQAYMPNQNAGRLTEDQQYKNTIYEFNRPFSAKVQLHRKQKIHSCKKSLLCKSSKKITTTQSFSSTKKLMHKRHNIKTSAQKLVAIPCNSLFEDSSEEVYINSLRKKKALELTYIKAKQDFMKTLNQQNERYPKINKKFIQITSKKSYYYNKNGQNIEINQKKLHKKNISNKIILKTENSKRAANQTTTQTKVLFRQKQNSLKKSRQAFAFDHKPPILFYKSQNCNYIIL